MTEVQMWFQGTIVMVLLLATVAVVPQSQAGDVPICVDRTGVYVGGCGPTTVGASHDPDTGVVRVWIIVSGEEVVEMDIDGPGIPLP